MLSKLWAAIKKFFQLETDQVHVFAKVYEHAQGGIVYYWEIAIESSDVFTRNAVQHSLYDQIADIYIKGIKGLPPGAGVEKFFDTKDCGIRSKHAFWTRENAEDELKALFPVVGKILANHEKIDGEHGTSFCK